MQIVEPFPCERELYLFMCIMKMVSGFIEARVRITIQYLPVGRSFLSLLCLFFFLSRNEPRRMGERLEQQEITTIILGISIIIMTIMSMG